MGASWAPIWASWAPKLAPSSVQDGSCDAFFVKKQILKKNKEKPMVFQGFCSRIWLRKRSKIAPRRPQDGLGEVLFRCSKSCLILIRFGFDFGCLWALPWAPKGDPKSIKFVSPTKGAPKRSPKRPQEAPRGPKRAPRGPKRRQEVPQKAPQSPKRALKRHQENPKRPQEAPGSPQGKVD